jgi:hypothetical protein
VSDIEVDKIRESVKIVSGKFAEIAMRSLQQNVKAAKHGFNFAHVKPPFCHWPGACDDKQLRTVYHSRGVKRRYQLCRSNTGCNQQTDKPMYYEVP